MTGAGEPPMPGMSNRMTGRRGSSTSTNGWNSSRLAPMPLHSSSGVQPAVPSRTETRMVRLPTARTLIRSGGPGGPLRRSRPRTRPRPDSARSSPAGTGGTGGDSSAVIDIRSRCGADRRQPAAAQIRGRGLLLAAALGQAASPVRPPGPVQGLGTAQPFLGVLRALLGHLVPGLLVARRIDHRGDVPAGRQDEPGAAAQQLSGPVAGLPGTDVVGDPGDDVAVAVDRGQVYR